MWINWVDAVSVVLIGLYVWQAWERNPLTNVNELISWVTAYVFYYYFRISLQTSLVRLLGMRESEASFGVDLVVILACQQLVFWTLQALIDRLKKQYFSVFWHGLLSFLPSLVSAVLLMGYIILVLISFPYPSVIQEDMKLSLLGIKLVAWLR